MVHCDTNDGKASVTLGHGDADDGKTSSKPIARCHSRTHVRPFSSTRMGRRPCSSASMSDGLHEWKAPLQMNRMWSVLTLPYLVETTDPSMMGSKSLWTPSELASAPPERQLNWKKRALASLTGAGGHPWQNVSLIQSTQFHARHRQISGVKLTVYMCGCWQCTGCLRR